MDRKWCGEGKMVSLQRLYELQSGDAHMVAFEGWGNIPCRNSLEQTVAHMSTDGLFASTSAHG